MFILSHKTTPYQASIDIYFGNCFVVSRRISQFSKKAYAMNREAEGDEEENHNTFIGILCCDIL